MRYVSLFSGIEAASVAWEPLGWEPMAFSEIDPFPCAVLAKRFPNVPNLGDVSKIDWRSFVETSGRPDVVVGGSPCQSFSIAGSRSGLQGQSGLMFEYVRAVQELRPRWFVWENVPGALSVEKGAAFGQLLAEMAECGYGLAWRILDAQFTRVPVYSRDGGLKGFVGPVAQRRRRVFLVGSIGTDNASKVLFEPESMRGDTLPSQKKREELVRAAERDPASGIFAFKYIAGAAAGSMPTYDDGSTPTVTADWHVPAVAYTQFGEEIAGTLTSRYDSSPCVDRGMNIVAFAQNSRDEVRLCGGDGQIVGAICSVADGDRQNYVLQAVIDNANANEDGDAYAVDSANGSACYCMATGQANAEIEENFSPTVMHGHERPIAVICVGSDTSNAAIDEDLASTLHVGRVNPSSREGRVVLSNGKDITGPLCARDHKGVGNEYVDEGKVVAYAPKPRQADSPCIGGDDSIYPVEISDGSKWVMRRLTPLECERLMGFPDGWTDIGEWTDDKGRPRKCVDGNRYKALGNSMAVPVMMWLGRRIAIEDEKRGRAS